MDKKQVKNIYPLTPLQEGMLFHALHGENSHAYFEQAYYRIKGQVDAALFEKAWAEVVARHDIFRTRFVHHNVPRPLQVVLKSGPFHFEYCDMRNISHQQEQIAQLKQRDLATPFDLTKGPLFRVYLIQCADAEYQVVMSFHHILMDGWSVGIVAHDFMAAYQQLAVNKRTSVNLIPAPPYANYVKWLEAQDKSAAKQAWVDYLAGLAKPTPVPMGPPLQSGYQVGEYALHLTPEHTKALHQLARRQQVTVSRIVQCAWGLVLGSLNQSSDAVFAATVSGRAPEVVQVEKMVGLFINAVPVRVNWQGQQTFNQLLQQVHQQQVGLQNYHYTSLAEIQAETPYRQQLLDHVLVFENYPVGGESEELPFQIDDFAVYEHTHYDFEIQAIPEADHLWFRLRFNEHKTGLAEVTAIAQQLLGVLELVTGSETLTLEQIVEASLPAVSKPAVSKLASSKLSFSKQALRLCLAASFTVDNWGEGVDAWLSAFAVRSEVVVCGYNQVFQQLLNHNSEFATNSGLNVALIRIEDVLREGGDVEQQAQLYMDAIQSYQGQAPLIVGLFPRDPAFGTELNERINAWEHQIKSLVSELPNGYVIDFASACQHYPVDTVFDALTNEQGHIPFSESYTRNLERELARTVLAYVGHRYKVIVTDLDNTLWQGVCAEEGATGVIVSDDHQALQQWLKEKRDQGFLLAIASKNNEHDAWSVFEQHPDMLLTKDDFVWAEINWQPKSTSMQAIAEGLNLGLDSLVFIDDSGAECSEVMLNCPQVLTLKLPQQPSQYPLFLEQVWACDKLKITQEDRQRTQLYQAEQKRQQAQQHSRWDDFLVNLQLCVCIQPLAEHQIERAEQLLLRTNQFNLNTQRHDASQLRAWMASPSHHIQTIAVRDRFGDYGLVGLTIAIDSESSLHIDSFLLSCRVLGRQVEDAMLVALAELAQQKGLNALDMRFVDSGRNAPFAEFIQRYSWQTLSESAGSRELTISVDKLPESLEHVTVVDSLPETDIAQTHTPRPSVDTHRQHAPLVQGALYYDWDTMLTNEAKLSHRAYYLPLVYHRQPLPLPNSFKTSRTVEQVELETETQKVIAAQFAELLKLDRVYLHDNYFELGGHSLQAISLIGRIHKALDVQISLKQLYQAPTVAMLADLVDGSLKQAIESIPRQPVGQAYPLSHAQKRLWLIQQLERDFSAYNMFSMTRLEGALNVDALEKAWQALVERHTVLRSHFIYKEGEPTQIVGTTPFCLAKTNLSTIAGAPTPNHSAFDLDDEREKLRFDQFCSALDLPADPATLTLLYCHVLAESQHVFCFEQSDESVIRVELIQLGVERYLMLVNIHHIATDGWSMQIIVEELLALYRQQSPHQQQPLPPLPIQYADFACWQPQQLETDSAQKAKHYWLSYLSSELPVLDVPTDYPRPALKSFDGDSVCWQWNSNRLEQLNQMAGRYQTTLFGCLTALVSLLLHHHSGQDDLLLGYPVANRTHPDIEPLVGFFVNTLVHRSQIAPELTFDAYLKRVAQNLTLHQQHQMTPFDWLVDALDRERDPSRTPLFDVMIVLQNIEQRTMDMEGVTIQPITLAPRASQFDLTFQFAVQGEVLALELIFNTSLYRADTIKQWLGHLDALLDSCLTKPLTPVHQLSLVNAASLSQLLFDFNPSRSPVPEMTIGEAFHHQARQNPKAQALVSDDVPISYRQLDHQSNALAFYLMEFCNSQPVAMLMSRSTRMIEVMLAIFKSGSPYLPLEGEYPDSRLSYMLKDANVGVLVTDKAHLTRANELVAGLGLEHPLQVVCIDALHLEPVAQLPNSATTSQDGAYIIYTSGSTGQPKGVLVPHHGLVNMALAQIEAFGISTSDRVLQFASVGFDASLSEVFMALLAGASCVIAQRPLADVLSEVERCITLYQVTVATFPPSLLAHMDLEIVANLNTVITAGEAIDPQLAQRVAKTCRYFNAYGPTENSVCTSIYPLPATQKVDGAIPIGRPISNNLCLVVNAHQQLLPPGMVGELVVAGDGLALEYINQPERSAESFRSFDDLTAQWTAERYAEISSDPRWVDSVAKNAAKYYRTGDRVRYNQKGELEFFGRIDQQVKLRGHRIEPGEIQAQLMSIPQVVDAYVFVHRPNSSASNATSSNASGSNAHSQSDQLLAYVVQGKNSLESQQILSILKLRLPSYMIPTQLFQLDQLPLTSNGKVDKKALPLANAVKHPSTPTAMLEGDNDVDQALLEQVVDVMGSVLEMAVEPSSHFFQQGGHSLLAVKFARQLSRCLKRDVSPLLVYQHPQAWALAQALTLPQADGLIYPLFSDVLSGVVSGPKVFCLPPLSGSGLSYVDLVAPISGIQWIGIDFRPQHDWFEQCVEAISQQAAGDIFLMGYSSGGNLAFEMTKRLELAGIEVRGLILLDSWRRIKAQHLSEQAIQEIIDWHHQSAEQTILSEMHDVASLTVYLNDISQRLNSGQVKANIYSIQAQHQNAEQGASQEYLTLDWQQSTLGHYQVHQGQGDHLSLFSKQAIDHNRRILEEVVTCGKV